MLTGKLMKPVMSASVDFTSINRDDGMRVQVVHPSRQWLVGFPVRELIIEAGD